MRITVGAGGIGQSLFCFYCNAYVIVEKRPERTFLVCLGRVACSQYTYAVFEVVGNCEIDSRYELRWIGWTLLFGHLQRWIMAYVPLDEWRSGIEGR